MRSAQGETSYAQPSSVQSRSADRTVRPLSPQKPAARTPPRSKDGQLCLSHAAARGSRKVLSLPLPSHIRDPRDYYGRGSQLPPQKDLMHERAAVRSRRQRR